MLVFNTLFGAMKSTEPFEALTGIVIDWPLARLMTSGVPVTGEYTARLTNPTGTEMKISLSNGETITIGKGLSEGSITFPAPQNTVYVDGPPSGAFRGHRGLRLASQVFISRLRLPPKGAAHLAATGTSTRPDEVALCGV
ncbi:immunoglobulin-like domain-containing protein [Pseudomonas sp. 148P]|uniref:Immunoglobulin-like domain-containing protein n=1 Tax=Pseudomonas ulcerans TaxID=3115852 RepID=A0ABU7I1Z1_9PSED|nr:immunoglobulin-like domain-containing protein [Pseudomonas sp. 148P]MEE1937815.1 immunoglobulin-like domain-containing protein [Pseudomonas sp. 148P]